RHSELLIERPHRFYRVDYAAIIAEGRDPCDRKPLRHSLGGQIALPRTHGTADKMSAESTVVKRFSQDNRMLRGSADVEAGNDSIDADSPYHLVRRTFGFSNERPSRPRQ